MEVVIVIILAIILGVIIDVVKISNAYNQIMNSIEDNPDTFQIVKDFKREKKLATELPSSKYSIDMESIQSLANVVRELQKGNIAKGMKMQLEDGPKTDWAIAGGLASGLAGSGAGIAAALNAMQSNEESTKKHHEEGKKLVEKGFNTINQMNNYVKEMNNIAIKTSNKMVYSEPLPSLLKSFKLNSKIIVLDNEEKIVLSVTNSKRETVNVSLKIYDYYNKIGYFKALVSIKNTKEEQFSQSGKKVRIDGGFRIDLYNEDGLFAYGYISDGSWSAKDHSDVGFKTTIKKIVTFKKVDDSKEIIKDSEYKIKFSNPNLWLVEL